MIARVRRSLDEKDKGFTLIELLVVVIIIGILSAIAIPVFMNQRKKAVDAAIKGDLKNVATVIESYYTDNGKYPTALNVSGTTVTLTDGAATGAITDTARISQGNGLNSYAVSTTTGGFCFRVTNASSTEPTNGFFYASSAGGVMAKGTSACPA
ncbi:type IV pilin protein [Cellulomonas marina]|uniref:Type II secretion system protein G n=1 Tax=Cellulomonas marina TaxID=988821 RepID=A0A1I0W6Z3_9CELL|nr:prepilin-type N-terminal cleavage/methylation domain-containing protein [Cellulomonas marina]GIG29133.1 hypothetical protein Cma02nite_17330 [Cellulomonas marina]SFA84539.1 type II secretion system protein G [Cellulomonas marina]